MKDNYQRMQTQLNMLADLGHTVTPEATILDLGCGNGELVNEYLKKGYDCYGCDFQFKTGIYVETLSASGRIRNITGENYRLPFDDVSIDCVLTDQVFEHVADYPATLAEINRILKPGGVSLNFFPSKYQIVEPHVHVPFASVFKNYYLLLVFACLGIKKEGQKGLSPKLVARANYEYLHSFTYYLEKSEIKAYCKQFFSYVKFAEDVFIKHLHRFRFLRMLSRTKLFPWLYSTFRHRVLFLVKGKGII